MRYFFTRWYEEMQIDDLAQDYSISIANVLEILQSCAKPTKYYTWILLWISETSFTEYIV